MLSEMLKYVIKISEDIRGLKDSSKNQEDLFKDQLVLDGKQLGLEEEQKDSSKNQEDLFKDQLVLDEKQLGLEEEQLDAANEARYEAEFAKKKPTPVGADGKDKKENTKEEEGFLGSLLGFATALRLLVSGPFRAFTAILGLILSPLRALGLLLGGPLLRGFSALGRAALPAARAVTAKALEYGSKAIAAATPYAKAAGAKALEYGGKALEVGKSVGRSALSYATEKAPTLVAGAKTIGSKAVDIGKNIGAKVAEKAPSIIEGVKTMGSGALANAKSFGNKAMESVGLKSAATVPGALTPFGEVGAKRAAAAGAEAAGKEGVAALIKKSIAKRIPMAVGSAFGKSIPYLGIAIGAGFALSRLMDGDVVGAGLEAVSGIGSFATAIPATVALLAKDVYEDVYGIKPESDPLVGERLGLIQSETETAVKAEVANKVGGEEKKGGDKKGNAPAETKVPEAPELKGGKADANIAATQTAPAVTAPVTPPSPASKAEQTRLSAKEMYQSSTKEEESAKLKLEDFKTANPFDIKEKGEIETGTYTPAKFSDAKKQKEYDALYDATYKASKKKEKAQTDYETADNTQRYETDKRGRQRENFKNTENKKDILVSRFGYKDSDLLNADGESYSISKINTAYDKEVKKDLLSPVSKSNVPNAIAPTSTDANIAQGQGQELKSGPAGIGANQPAPTSKTDATIAPTQEKRKMPNWEAALKDYETGTPVDNLERQFPGIKAKFIELAKKNPPSMDIPEVIESHEKMLATISMRDLKNKQVDTPEAQRMREIESKPRLQSAQPTTGEKMTKQSNENTMAKTEAMTGGNSVNTSIVSAPKVTNATNVLNAPINVRNSENTFVRNQNRIHDF
jgi:hypothetical protein